MLSAQTLIHLFILDFKRNESLNPLLTRKKACVTISALLSATGRIIGVLFDTELFFRV